MVIAINLLQFWIFLWLVLITLILYPIGTTLIHLMTVLTLASLWAVALYSWWMRRLIRDY